MVQKLLVDVTVFENKLKKAYGVSVGNGFGLMYEFGNYLRDWILFICFFHFLAILLFDSKIREKGENQGL